MHKPFFFFLGGKENKAGLMLTVGSSVHFYLLFFFFIRWFVGSPLKMGVFWDGGFSACGMPWVPWSWRCGRLRPHLQEEGRLKEGHSGAYCGPHHWVQGGGGSVSRRDIECWRSSALIQRAVLHLLMLKRKAKMAIAMAVAVTMETCFRDSMMHPPCRQK